MLVTNAITVGGDAKGRHALHETGRQAPQATVAQGRIGLQHADALKVDVQPAQRLTGDIQQAQVAQAVVQQAADQKLQRQVIHPLLALAVDLPGMVHPVIDHVIAGRQGNGFEPVVVEGMLRVLADRVGQFIQHSGAKSGHLCVTSERFLRHATSSTRLTNADGDFSA
ncbi:hypothetical protein D9M71_408590 [compost metagenome]